MSSIAAIAVLAMSCAPGQPARSHATPAATPPILRKIDQGAALTGDPIDEALIGVRSTSPRSIVLRVRLIDQDDSSPDDLLGDVTRTVAFEPGQSQEVTITLTGDRTMVRITFTVTAL